MLSILRNSTTVRFFLGLATFAIAPILNGCNVAGNGIGLGSQPVTLYWLVAVEDINGDGKADIVASYTYT
jgi:hypothetical protein